MTVHTQFFTTRKKRRPMMSRSISDLESAADSGHVHGARRRRDQINFFTIAEVAERLAVNPRTVRRRIKAGDLVAHQFGRAVRIAEGDLRAFLAAHRGAEP
jgi:excisionase family DNA binding protein